MIKKQKTYCLNCTSGTVFTGHALDVQYLCIRHEKNHIIKEILKSTVRLFSFNK